MKTLSGRILKLLKWEIVGQFPDITKSVVLIAPHTSNWDIVLGKLFMNEMGVSNKVLVKKELFFFPMNIIMKILGTLPVDRYDRENTIVYQTVNYIKNSKTFNLVVSAEGTRQKIDKWKKGFFYIAQKANVPIVVGYLDYKNKKLGIKSTIYEIDDVKKTMIKINELYKNSNAKYQENFTLDKRYT
jgi:1-acyl-sn-glycerol-3-phosphate acyltransferase